MPNGLLMTWSRALAYNINSSTCSHNSCSTTIVVICCVSWIRGNRTFDNFVSLCFLLCFFFLFCFVFMKPLLWTSIIPPRQMLVVQHKSPFHTCPATLKWSGHYPDELYGWTPMSELVVPNIKWNLHFQIPTTKSNGAHVQIEQVVRLTFRYSICLLVLECECEKLINPDNLIVMKLWSNDSCILFWACRVVPISTS